jgi:hypothetical protein
MFSNTTFITLENKHLKVFSQINLPSLNKSALRFELSFQTLSLHIYDKRVLLNYKKEAFIIEKPN